VVSLQLLFGIFVALMVLTFATVGATWIDLGYQGNLALALAIAVLKAALVMLYFMHLRWDSPFNSIIAIAALLFIAIFIVATITDTDQYKSNLLAPTQTPSQALPGQGALLPR
jgi:cytochrome c oxidase subunit 4